MTADDIKALVERLEEYGGRNTIHPHSGTWMLQAATALTELAAGVAGQHEIITTLSDQLLAKSALANLYAASLRQSEAEVEGLRRDALSVFRVIAEQDPVELALDPQWAQRIARSAISAMSKKEGL
jgi:uncharacterized coiled-coil protein SlyX